MNTTHLSAMITPEFDAWMAAYVPPAHLAAWTDKELTTVLYNNRTGNDGADLVGPDRIADGIRDELTFRRFAGEYGCDD